MSDLRYKRYKTLKTAQAALRRKRFDVLAHDVFDIDDRDGGHLIVIYAAPGEYEAEDISHIRAQGFLAAKLAARESFRERRGWRLVYEREAAPE